MIVPIHVRPFSSQHSNDSYYSIGDSKSDGGTKGNEGNNHNRIIVTDVNQNDETKIEGDT